MYWICLMCQMGIPLPMQRCRFDPWVGKTPWRRKWQPTPVFLPGRSHGHRSLARYSPWGRIGVRRDVASEQQSSRVPDTCAESQKCSESGNTVAAFHEYEILLCNLTFLLDSLTRIPCFVLGLFFLFKLDDNCLRRCVGFCHIPV